MVEALWPQKLSDCLPWIINSKKGFSRDPIPFRREADMFPAPQFKNTPGNIFFVKTLHNRDHGRSFRVIKPGTPHHIEPLKIGFANSIRLGRLGRLIWYRCRGCGMDYSRKVKVQ